MPNLAIHGAPPVRTNTFPDWPVHGDAERTGLLEVLESGNWWYGQKVREFEEQYASFHDAKYGISAMNGAMALEMALWACGIQAGDEVITTPYSFIATPVSALRLNAVPVFADINLETFNLDLESVKSKVTKQTKMILPVHLGGVPVNMDAFNEFGQSNHLRIVEDACHSWGSKWRGKGTGALGQCGAFSFQMSKNITAGEGGILLTDDAEIAELARSFSNCGRGREIWYRHYVPGSNLRMTEFQAAILLAQLARLEDQTLRRESNAQLLDRGLESLPGVRTQKCDSRVTRRGVHIYLFRFIPEEWDGADRETFMAAVAAEGVPVWAGYPDPLYRMPVFTHASDESDGLKATARPYHADSVNYNDVHCPNAEQLCREAVWINQTQMLGSSADMQDIIDAISKVWEHRLDLRTA